MRIAPMSTAAVDDVIERRSDPQGRQYYWLMGNFESAGHVRGTDRHLVREGYVCITPLQFDLTDRAMLKLLDSWNQEGEGL